MTSFCDYGHCVHNTFVSLTEGRSARDLPKQQPAQKKKHLRFSADDFLHSSATARLEAHLRDGPAPHILLEDEDQLEEVPVDDPPISTNTDAAFLSLLQAVDSSAKDISESSENSLPCHVSPPTHIPLSLSYLRP